MKSTKTVQKYKNTAKEPNRASLKQSQAESGFADPDRVKDQNKVSKPANSFASPWDFSCPNYDQRSSNFINAGTHYGIAMRQPVGHEGNPKVEVPTLPQQRVVTMQVDDLG